MAKEEVRFFGSGADFIDFVSWDEEREWIRRRMAKGIFIKSLLLPCGDAITLQAKDKDELRETRILKDAVPFVTSFQLFANKVLIWQPKAPLALLIEDEYIVQMLESVFEFLWKRTDGGKLQT